MKNQDFTLILWSNQTPEKVFQAINNVWAWWSGYYAEEIIGNTENLNDEFSFRAGGDVHFTKHKVIEVIPNKKIVWLTTHSDFNYIEKSDEWTGSKVIFEISEKENQTQLKFTHQGLTPDIECYDSCAPAWTMYLQHKLLPLIENKSFTTTILVDKDPAAAFNAIKNFRAWWSEEIEGNTDMLNEEFFYHYKDVHLCKLKLIEVLPNKELVYLVLDNQFNFINDNSEWVNTKLIFQITTEGDKTKVQFTHLGLVPAYECYTICSDAWSGYINKSLCNLINTGKGTPNPKNDDGFN